MSVVLLGKILFCSLSQNKTLKCEANVSKNVANTPTLTLPCLPAGSSEACGGATGEQELHDTPLIFDLENDEAEETPLVVGTPEYQAVADRISRKREELLWDIATDTSVSTADYSTDASAAPCCDPRLAVCRCHPQGRRDRN